MPFLPQPKPAKGTYLIERKERRKAVVKEEEANKAIVRSRDKKCRFPYCPNCRRYKGLINQVAHVVQPKGQGGDPSGIRSTPDRMMYLDPITHAAQERHEIDVVPLTALGTNGICEFYLVEDVFDHETGTFSTARLLWAREKAIGVPEHQFPLVKHRPVRRPQEAD